MILFQVDNSSKGADCMKKMMALLFALVCVLGFVACSTNDANSPKPQTGEHNTAANPDANSPTIVDSDATTKAELIEKYGDRFKFYLAFDMELITFHFDETTVVRKHHDSMKDDVPTHNATWDIVDGELVVYGEWNESFILNLETNIAISKTDGREYPIYKVD